MKTPPGYTRDHWLAGKEVSVDGFKARLDAFGDTDATRGRWLYTVLEGPEKGQQFSGELELEESVE